ncbi:hypothetical protein BAUCODRAFT_485155 [Baudoinia panamericana UAMH 10762]|uniref:RhoGAP-domain-containing protein n=1 Tax=Baudoinia panamericana (strain UAMH 10762) TaxID=717646 RepID=M2NCN6_BAUPA|nr:uncharacterized protein BAUCODRAFT_485155 [Baudoinia panamericana UAMH 10762]EMC96665.1 hypothetical protein BAUCODRAFT_485155 [Baudoinia panamericana UAMH 10762]
MRWCSRARVVERSWKKGRYDDRQYGLLLLAEGIDEIQAFELAGNRWHIDCFRCNTCGTLLDSDANLLLLGDGSLICNNCTYSCNACGNKIEDLAILTGDQAFCASCFRCRNCKRKIENLRYARTSQGIFCMSCHESLMARRRKKAKTTRQPQTGANGGAPAVEKALPSLPPGAATQSAFSPDLETPESDVQVETPGPPPPRHQQPLLRKEPSPSSYNRDVSPLSDESRRDGPTLPASTYGSHRPSYVSEATEDGEERGFLPMAFDPTPAPGPPPTIPRKQVPRPPDPSPPPQNEARLGRDYFSGKLSAKGAHREALREDRSPSTRSISTEREPEKRQEQAKTSPHILYQDKGRTTKKRDGSGTNTPAPTAASPVMVTAPEARPDRPKPQHNDTTSFTLHRNASFKLQEVPKARKAEQRSSFNAENKSPVPLLPLDTQPGDVKEKESTVSPISVDSIGSGVNPFDDPKRRDGAPTSAAPPPPKHADRPLRGDSLTASQQRPSAPSTEPSTPATVPAPSTVTTQTIAPDHHRKSSASSAPFSFSDAHSTLGPDNSRSTSVDSPQPRSSFEAPPPRNSSRLTAPSKPLNGEFAVPRLPPPPPPPPETRHRNNDSISTMQSVDVRSDGHLSPSLRSAGLPKHSAEGTFSMEEEMARILRGDRKEHRDVDAGHSSVLRRVSNAVKHGRSFSDRGAMAAKSPANGSLEISSPMSIGSPSISSPNKEPLEQLRSQNRRQAQRIAELEAERAAMEERLNQSAEIKAATSELQQKRNTLVDLDTQREMVVAELESMTAHLQKAKDSNQRLDLQPLQADILRDFAERLQRLKDSMTKQIEELMRQRNELTSEIGTLIQMKDKGFQEYEALTGRNHQLLEMNNQLVHGLQETYRANRGANGAAAVAGAANGLGIYHPGARLETPGPSDVRNLSLVGTDSSVPNILHETEAEPATVLDAPQVVNIRKGGQAKKFNWRKGGGAVARNVAKGIKGTFAGESSVRGKEIGAPYSATDIGTPYGQMPQQNLPGSDQNSLNGKQSVETKPGAGFGFFSTPKATGGLKAGQMGSMKNSSSTNLAVTSTDPTVLFGSDLEARCEHEKRMIPSIVTRCIAEVERRGMDVEGVYRKSGGSGQVKSVQQGFEKDGNYDLSDPDLDIHAVTSALKQYFRKLPTPLITYDAYDSLLEAGQMSDGEKQAYHLRLAVADLPEHHRNCLEYLVQHLVRVMAHESDNLMTPLNLAVVFAPTIMRPLSIEREMSDMQAQRMAVQALLEQHEAIFDADE